MPESRNRAAITLSRAKCGLLGVESRIEGRAAHLIVDTGASRTVLDQRRADALGLVTESVDGQAVGYHEVGCPRRARLESLQVGRVDLGPQELVVLDLSTVNARLEADGSRAADGILGGDLLAKAEAEIRYSNLSLTLVVPDQGP